LEAESGDAEPLTSLEKAREDEEGDDLTSTCLLNPAALLALVGGMLAPPAAAEGMRACITELVPLVWWFCGLPVKPEVVAVEEDDGVRCSCSALW